MSNQASSALPQKALQRDRPYRRYRCDVCGFIYDEALGLPEDGIAAGTRWEDIPESYVCPDCGIAKVDFVMALADD